jgi:GT2 family glycosyltransferase
MSEDDTKNIVFAIPNRSSSSQINAELANVIHSLGSDHMPESGDYNVKVSFNYLQPVDANRNQMVKDFLGDEDNEWLIMCDNDVVPPRDILQMVDYGEKVVSATVTIKKERVPQPVIVKQRDDGQYRQMGMDEYYEEIDDEGLVEVDGVGTGCILIHRSVVEDIEPPWFRFIYNDDGTLELGEDFYFGEKLRQNDYSMYVSSEHVCSHFRKTDLTDFAQVVAEVDKSKDE